VRSAFEQLQTYKNAIPGLFVANGLLVASDGLEARVGSLSAGYTRFMAWKSADGEKEASHLVGQLETWRTTDYQSVTLMRRSTQRRNIVPAMNTGTAIIARTVIDGLPRG